MADGGFLPAFPAGLPSPSPSLASTASATASSTLPNPRSKPLVPGSVKEVKFREFVDRGIEQIHNRWAQKLMPDDSVEEREEDARTGDVPMGNPLPSLMRPGRKGGYTTMRELCTDISALVDVVWLSGTPVLQIPYLLALADFVPSYLPSFPASPRAMFTLLVKLDAALSSMLRSRSLAAAVLRGMSELYTKRDRMTQTDVVRLQSIVSRSRVAVTRLVSSIGGQAEDSDGDEETAGDDTEEDFMAQEDGQWDMQTARVYEQTILAMGDKFGGEVIT